MTSNLDRLVADTHTLVWHLTDSPRLSDLARRLMDSIDEGGAELIVPTIVLAEALHVSERRNPGVSFDEVMTYISDMPTAVVAALDLPVIRETRRLSPSLEMHDRIIAATARLYGARLISRDRQLGSLVETVW